VNAINAAYDQTGVIAELNANSELVLVAKDGRNIQVSYTDGGANDGQALETLIGLRSGTDYAGIPSGTFVYGGKLTLQSDTTFELDFNGSVNNSLGAISQSGQPGVFGTNEKNSFDTIDVLDIRNINPALDTIDLAIDQVSSKRAELGAMQNRLESTINNLNQNAENLSAASSRIKDADFATETATLASNQIKQQAAVSILSQMSASGQLLLNLLR
jgi:flagellin